MVQYYLEFFNNELVESVTIHNNYKEIVEYIGEKYNTKILQSELSSYMKHEKFTKDIFKKIRIREVPPLNIEKKDKQDNKKTRMKCDCGYSNKYSKHKCTSSNEN